VAASWSVRRTPLETTVPALLAAAEAAWNGRRTHNLASVLAGEIAAGRHSDLIAVLDKIGQSGTSLLNGIGSTSGAWDRRHDRWGISPLLSRMRKADLVSLTESSADVKFARAAQREARSAMNKLARISPSPAMHPTFMNVWRYAARETAHKAGQWLYLWQISRLVKTGRGSAASLARQGAALVEDIRKCMRDFKRSVGPSLAGGGLEEEFDVHFGGESRLLRRIVRTLRTSQSRTAIRTALAEMLGLPAPAEK
jgi:hypothetical protein